MRTKPTKRDRIDTWLAGKKVGFKFYARQLGYSIGLTASEVVPYLKWHKRVLHLGDSLSQPNWVVV